MICAKRRPWFFNLYVGTEALTGVLGDCGTEKREEVGDFGDHI
jgi:hypothetical protein